MPTTTEMPADGVTEAVTSPAATAAEALFGTLIAAGVTDVVVCPGSRSQALALVAARLEREGRIRLHVRIDERVAAFTALGIAIETGRPAPVVVTSGTAVAELHPAVLEAHHAGVPMLLLTADRPAELRGIGSNQTTDQPAVFGPALRGRWDVTAPRTDDDAMEAAAVAAQAVRLAMSAPAGPVQLNLAFREPLSGPAGAKVVAAEPAPVVAGATATTVSPGPRTIVVAGDRAGEAAARFAQDLGVPLVAEVTSGARFGPTLVPAYREVLDALGDQVERAVVFGHPTLSRQIPALLGRADLEVLLVGGTAGEWFDPTRGRAQRTRAVEAAGADDERAWLGAWITVGRAAERDADVAYPVGARDTTRAELSALRAPVTRPFLAQSIWRATWPHDRLVFGASRLIREADGVVPGKRITALANRGLAGIDGTVSTAYGIAQSRTGSGGTVRVLLGDITLLHDAGALLRSPGEAAPRIQVVVGNDGGGSLFDSLEVRAAEGDLFDRVQFTPQEADLAALAAAYGWAYRRVENRGDLDRALTAPAAGPELIEVPLPR